MGKYLESQAKSHMAKQMPSLEKICPDLPKSVDYCSGRSSLPWPEYASQVAEQKNALDKRAGCGAFLRFVGFIFFLKENINAFHGI